MTAGALNQTLAVRAELALRGLKQIFLIFSAQPTCLILPLTEYRKHEQRLRGWLIQSLRRQLYPFRFKNFCLKYWIP